MQIGVYQSAGGGLSLDERLSRLENAIRAANHDGDDKLDLVVCPELFSSGYNVGDQLVASAQVPEGSTFDHVSKMATDLETAIVYGYPEQGDSCLYNSAAFVSAEGALLANHRKQLNSPGSFEEDYFTPGNKATFLTYKGFKIAILICYEVEFPESVRNAADDGAQLVVVPTALVSQWDIVASRVVPTRAFENGLWLAYSNHAGHENGLDYLGGSKIVAPNGNILADAGSNENLISTKVDISSVEAAQKRLPYLRDYAKFTSIPKTK